MDKFDFINRIIALYPHAITDKQAQYDTYSRALSANKIDFEKLMDIFANEYKDGFPPPAATLKEMAARCIKTEYEVKRIKQVRFMNTLTGLVRSTDAFEGNYTDEQLLRWKRIKSGHDNWELVEVY